MYGLKLKYLKSSLLIVASLIAIILAFSYLPHALLALLGAGVVILGVSFALGHNTWKQTKDIGSRPSRAAGAGPQRGERKSGDRKSRAEARASRRAGVLHPEETVTLSEEREAAGIEDVFTSLDNQLVGLVPVKKEGTRRSPRCCWSTGSGTGSASMSPGPTCTCASPGDPGTGKTTVALRMADLLYPARLPGKGAPSPRHA